ASARGLEREPGQTTTCSTPAATRPSTRARAQRRLTVPRSTAPPSPRPRPASRGAAPVHAAGGIAGTARGLWDRVPPTGSLGSATVRRLPGTGLRPGVGFHPQGGCQRLQLEGRLPPLPLGVRARHDAAPGEEPRLRPPEEP